MELVGYARVSTREERQVFDRQVDALRAASCERIFDDRGSGASADRPGLKACLDYLRRGDVLVVLDLDRLGRLAGELIRLVDELEGRGVGFRALNASFDTTTPMGRAFLQIQATFAEMERIRHPPAGQGGRRGRACPWPQGRPSAPDDGRAAALCPAPHDRPQPQHPRNLPRAGQRAREHALPLLARRRHAEGAGLQIARDKYRWKGAGRVSGRLITPPGRRA